MKERGVFCECSMSDNPSPIRHSGRAGWRMRLSSVLNGGLHDVGLLVPWTILAALLTGGIVAGLASASAPRWSSSR
jgi:hypothetical protein